MCVTVCAQCGGTRAPRPGCPQGRLGYFPGTLSPGFFLYGSKKRPLSIVRREPAPEKSLRKTIPARAEETGCRVKEEAGRPSPVRPEYETVRGTAQGSDAPFRGSAYSGDDSAFPVRSSPVKGQGAGALAAGRHGNHPRISPEENVTVQPRPADSWKERGSPSPEKSAICGLRGVSRPAGPRNCRTCCVRSLPSPGTVSRVWRRRADHYR